MKAQQQQQTPQQFVLLTPEQLNDIVADAVRKGVESASASTTYNHAELAAFLGVSSRTVARWLSNGTLEPPALGGRWTSEQAKKMLSSSAKA